MKATRRGIRRTVAGVLSLVLGLSLLGLSGAVVLQVNVITASDDAASLPPFARLIEQLIETMAKIFAVDLAGQSPAAVAQSLTYAVLVLAVAGVACVAVALQLLLRHRS